VAPPPSQSRSSSTASRQYANSMLSSVLPTPPLPDMTVMIRPASSSGALSRSAPIWSVVCVVSMRVSLPHPASTGPGARAVAARSMTPGGSVARATGTRLPKRPGARLSGRPGGGRPFARSLGRPRAYKAHFSCSYGFMLPIATEYYNYYNTGMTNTDPLETARQLRAERKDLDQRIKAADEAAVAHGFAQGMNSAQIA